MCKDKCMVPTYLIVYIIITEYHYYTGNIIIYSWNLIWTIFKIFLCLRKCTILFILYYNNHAMFYLRLWV